MPGSLIDELKCFGKNFLGYNKKPLLRKGNG
jgi:hypothetical protein